MERRSFLASLAALFVARKLPAAEPETVEWHGVFIDGWRWSRNGAPFAEEPRPPVEIFSETQYPASALVRTAPHAGRVRVRHGIHTLEEMRKWTPDVWGNGDSATSLTISTSAS